MKFEPEIRCHNLLSAWWNKNMEQNQVFGFLLTFFVFFSHSFVLCSLDPCFPRRLWWARSLWQTRKCWPVTVRRTVRLSGLWTWCERNGRAWQQPLSTFTSFDIGPRLLEYTWNIIWILVLMFCFYLDLIMLIISSGRFIEEFCPVFR